MGTIEKAQLKKVLLLRNRQTLPRGVAVPGHTTSKKELFVGRSPPRSAVKTFVFPSLIGSLVLESVCESTRSRLGFLLGRHSALTEAVLFSSPYVFQVLHSAGAGSSSPLGFGSLIVSAQLATVMGTETRSGVSSLLPMEVLLAGYSAQSMRFRSATALSGSSSSLYTSQNERV